MKESYIKFKNSFKDFIKKSLNKDTRKTQIHNMLTASRLISPVLIIPSALTGNFALAGLLTAGFALTDAIDGKYARKHNLTSDFGRDLDALTDKIFAGTILISLLPLYPLLGVNLALEAIIGGTNTLSKIKNNDPKSSVVGKIKTVFLSTLAVVTYGNTFLNIDSSILNALFLSTTTLQTITAGDYIKKHYTKEINKRKKEILSINEIVENEASKELSKDLNKNINNVKDYDNSLKSHLEYPSKIKVKKLERKKYY